MLLDVEAPRNRFEIGPQMSLVTLNHYPVQNEAFANSNPYWFASEQQAICELVAFAAGRLRLLAQEDDEDL